MADTAGFNTSDFRNGAADVLESAMDGLARGAETQKNAGADAVSGFARAVRETAASLDADSPQIAQFVRQTADQVERLSQDIKTRDIGELLDATTEFARRRPYVFLGLGAVAGALLVRALAAPR